VEIWRGPLICKLDFSKFLKRIIANWMNRYFDGSWKTATAPRSLLTLGPSRKRKESSKSVESLSVANLLQVEPVHENGDLISMPEKRYIGAFGVAGWATKSGTGMISHGESIRIERQRQASQTTAARKATARKTKGKKETESEGPVAPGRNPPMRQRKTQDIVVRFTNSKGEEVGRLPQDTAAFVSTLIDQHICSFEGLCVYAPDKIRTNDTINIQLRCFMLRRGFEQRNIQPIDTNRAADIVAAKETDDEKALRLRQVALVRLFQEIDLEPSATNATTTKHKRAGILQAAEMAEQYEAAGPEAASSAGKEVSEGEKEEGKELEQDQLDQLYRLWPFEYTVMCKLLLTSIISIGKAQSFDFDYPETEPADTFAMDLRRYQKQALHWFLNKEKNISERDDESMHPLWEEYIWPIKDESDAKLPRVIGKDKFYVNPYSGELSLEFPRQEQNCLGGILADGMLSQF
jgi:DNA repair protein RAD5